MREEATGTASASAFAFASPQAILTSNAIEAMVSMQSFSHLSPCLAFVLRPRDVLVRRAESTFAKLFSLAALVSTQFLYQVRQNYPACAHAEYLLSIDGGTMPLDIKQLTIQPCDRFWHPNCNGNGRRMILAPSVSGMRCVSAGRQSDS